MTGAAPDRRQGCRADRDGECSWGHCPQITDSEPAASGRHCPLDVAYDDWGDPDPADVARRDVYLAEHPLPDRRQDERACTEVVEWRCGRCGGTPYEHGLSESTCVYDPVSPVPGQQREAVADELARHADTMAYTRDDDTVRLGCRCGHDRGTVTKRELASDLNGRMRAYRLHVADAVLAVLNGPQSPPSHAGRAEGGGQVSSGARDRTGPLTAKDERATTDGNGADPTTTEGRR